MTEKLAQEDTQCPTLAKIADLLKQGSEHQRWQQLDQAESLYSEAVDLAEKELDPNHTALGYALSDLAQLQEARGDEINARNNFIKSLNILERHLGNQHPVTMDIFGRLHHLFR